MKSLKSLNLLVLLSCVFACGRQIVEFKDGERTDAGLDARADASIDAGIDLAPTVISTVPNDAAIAVARDATIFATFSKAMDPTTITALTFVVTQGVTPVAGAVALDGPSRTATFAPTMPLLANLVYTATITTGAKDLGGRALAASHVWHFTTGANVNESRPTVIFTSPAALATNVSVNKRPTATFSKAMDPATLTALSFTLAQGLTPIPGAVSYDPATNTATIAPLSPLVIDTVYTATITTGAEDTRGLGLAASYVWTFKTGACSQAPVVLAASGGFGALAGSTVTNTGPTSLTGDLGVSPGTAVTGFPPGIIIGAIHAGDPAAATGIANLTTAYNDAAGRALCAVTVAGNLGGRTLPPGLYKSTSTLAISSGDLTLDAQGEGDAVFIFEMASTLTTTAGRQVILTNGAKAANVFWQVGTSATLGTGSAFAGTIMADQAVTLETGAILNGRALARIAGVTLDSNIIVVPLP
jgi:ice-binding like protein/Big-like domain-containing protein